MEQVAKLRVKPVEQRRNKGAENDSESEYIYTVLADNV